MQRSEILAEIRRLLGDTNSSSYRWSDDEINTRMEFAQQDVITQTGCVKTTESLTPTADTNEVSLDSGVLDITGATWTDTDGSEFPLTFKSQEDLDFYRPNWRNETGSRPDVISYDPSNNQAILVPAPTSADISSGCLKVIEVQSPTPLTSDSSVPFDSNARMGPFSLSIVHWVVAQCFMDDGTPEALAKARFHKTNDMDKPGEYEKVINKINSRFKAVSAIPERIKWRPQGGLRGGSRWPNHANPFYY